MNFGVILFELSLAPATYAPHKIYKQQKSYNKYHASHQQARYELYVLAVACMDEGCTVIIGAVICHCYCIHYTTDTPVMISDV